MDLPEYNDLKRALERKQREIDEARGRRQAMEERLKTEFNVETPDQGRAKLQELKQDLEEKKAKYERAWCSFRDQYPQFADTIARS